MPLFLSLWCCLLNSHWIAWVFLSAGNTACCCSWSQQTLSPPNGSFPRRLPSRIPNLPGTHFQDAFVAELCACCFTAPHAHADICSHLGFLVQHVDSVLTLLWQHIKLSFSLSWWHLVYASGPSFWVSLQQCLKSVLASLHWCFLPMPCLTICSGLQCFVLHSDSSFGLTSKLNARSTLSLCRCSIYTSCTSPRSCTSR